METEETPVSAESSGNTGQRMEMCGVPAHLWGPKVPGVTLQVTEKRQGGCPLACGACGGCPCWTEVPLGNNGL